MGRFEWDGKRNQLKHSIEILRATLTGISLTSRMAHGTVLVSCQATVNEVSQHVGERQLSVLPRAGHECPEY